MQSGGEQPANIPATPERAYEHDGWQGYAHWLGVAPGAASASNTQPRFMPFAQALVFARGLKLKTLKEWEAWRKSGVRPANLPATPNRTYKDCGWRGYPYFLGYAKDGSGDGDGDGAGAGEGAGEGAGAPTVRRFDAAVMFARSLGLSTRDEWGAWSTCAARPADIPTHPHEAYAGGGWRGFEHWLGTDAGVVAKPDAGFLPFDEVLPLVRGLNLKSQKEYRAWLNDTGRPSSMPAAPERTYRHQGWQGCVL